MTIRKRPVFLNLLRIRQPVTAVVSILHRLSGVLLILLVPFLLYFFEHSLQSESGFHEVMAMLQSIPAKVVGLLLAWALAHHLLAGVRFLLLDMDVGIAKTSARRGAWLVHGGAILFVLSMAGYLF
jgi:succinate dehydrogenase / fumarate reductase cytochrome b subunit